MLLLLWVHRESTDVTLLQTLLRLLHCRVARSPPRLAAIRRDVRITIPCPTRGQERHSKKGRQGTNKTIFTRDEQTTKTKQNRNGIQGEETAAPHALNAPSAILNPSCAPTATLTPFDGHALIIPLHRELPKSINQSPTIPGSTSPPRRTEKKGRAHTPHQVGALHKFSSPRGSSFLPPSLCSLACSQRHSGTFKDRSLAALPLQASTRLLDWGFSSNCDPSQGFAIHSQFTHSRLLSIALHHLHFRSASHPHASARFSSWHRLHCFHTHTHSFRLLRVSSSSSSSRAPADKSPHTLTPTPTPALQRPRPRRPRPGPSQAKPAQFVPHPPASSRANSSAQFPVPSSSSNPPQSCQPTPDNLPPAHCLLSSRPTHHRSRLLDHARFVLGYLLLITLWTAGLPPSISRRPQLAARNPPVRHPTATILACPSLSPPSPVIWLPSVVRCSSSTRPRPRFEPPPRASLLAQYMHD